MTLNQAVSVSIVIPTLNESEGIVNTINSVIESLGSFNSYEIIVVDDSSTDGTSEIVNQLAFVNPKVICLSRRGARSLGASVGDGVRAARNQVLIIMDADLTHNPSYIPKMVGMLTDFDVIIGSRFVPGGGMPVFGHYLSSRIFNVFIRSLLRTKVSDNLSGFLVFNKQDFSEEDMNLIFYGYGDFAIRLIVFFNFLNLRIKEFPIIYRLRTHGKSKSNFLKLLFRYGFATIRATRIPF